MIFIIFLTLTTSLETVYSIKTLHLKTWSVKPYIYVHNNNTADGIIIDIIKQCNRLCHPDVEVNLQVDIATDYPTFYQKYIKQSRQNESELNTIYFPILSDEDDNEGRYIEIYEIKGISLIASRDVIGIYWRLLKALVHTNIGMSMALMFAMIIGFIICLMVSETKAAF